MRSALVYGAMASIILIVTKLLIYFFHLQLTSTGILAGLLSIGLLALPLFAAIKNKRDKELGGFISLRQGMRAGLGVSAVAGLIFAAFTYLYYQFIDHETAVLVIERVTAQMIEAKSTQAQIDKEIIFQKEFYSPENQAFKGGLLSILGSGFVLSFICSTILTHKENS